MTYSTGEGVASAVSAMPMNAVSVDGIDSAVVDEVQYVAAHGSNSNNGLSWATAKATIAAAMAALPTCAIHGVRGGATSATCGTIRLSAGVFPLPSGIMIRSPLVAIRGAGVNTTELDYKGSGCAITLDFGSGISADDEYMPVALSGFSINGSGNTNTNACGLESTYLSNTTIRDVQIANFTAAGDSCLWLNGGPGGSAGNSFNERNNLGPMWLGNCTTGWRITIPSTRNRRENTVGYGTVTLYVNVKANQTGISSEGTSSTQLLMQYETFHIIVNIPTTAGTTCADFRYSTWTSDLGTWRCDGLAGTDFAVDAHSLIRLGGVIALAGNNHIARGGILDLTLVSTNKGNGPFVLWHETSAGREYSAIQPSTVGSFFNFMPSSNGTLALQGTNGVSAGTIKLSSGFGSHRFSGAYHTAPVCTAVDRTREAPIKVSNNATEVTVAGPGNDVVAWICTPAVN